MVINDIILVDLNEDDIYSSVDFQLPDTHVHIELKYRRVKSDAYSLLFFDKKKLIFGTRWPYYQIVLYI